MPLSGNIGIISFSTFHFRIGLGALLSGARHITDGMLREAAERYFNLDTSFVLPKAVRLGIDGSLVNYFLDVCRAALVLGIAIEQSDLALVACLFSASFL